MSVVCESAYTLLPPPRKRTSSSFCTPSSSCAPARPSKAPRLGMSTLTRTESCASIDPSAPYTSYMRTGSSKVEHRLGTSSKSISRGAPAFPAARDDTPIVAPTPRHSTTSTPSYQQHSPRSSTPIISCRTSSPLSPSRKFLPARPSFPRSKAEPDLYRLAIKTRMQHSPQGNKILHMGPRLAVSIMTATLELERIIAAQPQDVDMMDDDEPHLSMNGPWVVVPGEDWEMVDCTA
jgi:hypothetical protein